LTNSTALYRITPYTCTHKHNPLYSVSHS